METRPTPATIHLGMLIQHADQWAHTGGGDTRRGRAGRSFGGRAARVAADLGRGSAARPARPGPGPRPERPPSLLQPWRPAGEPWRLSAPGHPAGPAGPPRPALPALNLRPRPCRCPHRRRAPQGKAQLDEVMAAAALTSLSTSPLLLGPPTAGFHSEPGLEPWSEPPVQPLGSHSSSGGDWGWDPASELSSPPTPSPPLSLEAAHFLFGEPAPRKRKGAVQVLFQCLWKRCGEVLSTASGMQRHIRLAHLGRQAEPEQSDGEEDFYYTELDIGLEVLTGGLSSLASMSPTASLPPGFPHLELREPPALPSLLRPLALPPPQVLSSVAHPQVCRSDHSYQEAPRGRQEVPESVRRAAPGPLVHCLPLEEGLPALSGHRRLPGTPKLPEEEMSCATALPGALQAARSTSQWGRGIRDPGAPEVGEGPSTQSASEETSLLH
ncbi:SLC2A4 regulator isoform X2 [Artibeus jamaicensis]|uniref:SLC2A4 regulator isoform X2 n=1 Tax=Artibeus jamaicensis TaxID=9417 RepID=UPI00235A8AAD|nr:SLC2A4 regulator isoform X2 [Artibeus jamaicensis]